MNDSNDKEINYENRINQLLTELSESREDERNSQNQILQVISIAETFLGFLFGISFFQNESSNVEILFYLSLLVFFIAFSYIIVLGINNVLRYYYIQTIEDRLNVMISYGEDDDRRGKLLHWNAYSAPILTKNPKHISSSHAALNYFCYIISIVCMVLFSMAMVTMLFFEIKNRKMYHMFILLIALTTMVVTFLLFLRLTLNAEKIAKVSWDTAHDNQNARIDFIGTVYKDAPVFRKIFSYLLYPKKQDLQKPLLIVLGFISGIILSGKCMKVEYIRNLIMVLIVFDFFAYQARYQINDIRGIEEDKEFSKIKSSIYAEVKDKKHLIKISGIIALVKIVLAIIITLFFEKGIRRNVLISFFLLFVSTLFYEFAKEKCKSKNEKIAKCSIGFVLFFVGMGYPLRYFLGFFLIIPIEKALIPVVCCLIVGLWAYGCFSSILSWIDQISNKIGKTDVEKRFSERYEKKHFEYLREKIKEYYLKAEMSKTDDGRVFPLREKFKSNEIWNIIYFISMLFLVIAAILNNTPKVVLSFDVAFCFCVFFYSSLEKEKKLVSFVISCFLILLKGILVIIFFEEFRWYIVINMIQLLITATYYILIYQPKHLEVKKTIKKTKDWVLGKLLGDNAIKILKKDVK